MSFKSLKPEPKDNNPEAVLQKFVQQSPSAKYTFDSQRGSDHSEICRHEKGRKDCIEIWLNSKQMFEAMQENGFFCALPMEPGMTYMDCRPIPKS